MPIEQAKLFTSSYGLGTVETYILYCPTSSEILNFVHKYRALRVMLMKDGSANRLVAMPATAGDHGALGRYFMEQGMEIVWGSLYHIVDSEPVPFLTLDGGYRKETAIEYMYQEFIDAQYTDSEIEGSKLLFETLPSCIDKTLAIAAMDQYILHLNNVLPVTYKALQKSKDYSNMLL